MSDLTDMLVRAAGVSSVAGTVGARIGGSSVGGLIGSACGFVCSLCSDLFG